MSPLFAVLALSVVSGQIPGPHGARSPFQRRQTSTTSYRPSAPSSTAQLIAGDQYYQGNLTGIRHYLNDVRATDEELFTLLDPELQRLEAQSRRSILIIGISVGAGLLMTAVGTVVFVTAFPGFSPGDPGFQDGFGRAGLGLGLGFVGIIGMVAGTFVGLFNAPSTTQLLDLVNQHNRTRPERPLRLELGFAPTLDGRGGVALAYGRF